MSEEMVHNINPDLVDLAFPIEQLRTLPGNPRKGNIPAVAESYVQFGQQKPIVARRDETDPEYGIVLAGNTQFQAARDMLMWTHIAVTWVDDWDDKKAAAFALADNRTHDLGEYDDENLLAMLSEIADDQALVDASGYDEDFFNDLAEASDDVGGTFEDDLEDLGYADDGEEEDNQEAAPQRKAPQPVVQYQLVFDNEAQQQRWFSFVRWLRKEYDGDSIAARLDLFLDATGFEDD